MKRAAGAIVWMPPVDAVGAAGLESTLRAYTAVAHCLRAVYGVKCLLCLKFKLWRTQYTLNTDSIEI